MTSQTVSAIPDFSEVNIFYKMWSCATVAVLSCCFAVQSIVTKHIFFMNFTVSSHFLRMFEFLQVIK